MADEIKRWDAVDYEVISVTATETMSAVFAIEHETEKGKYIFDVWPMHLIGVAKLTSEYYEKRPDEKYGRHIETENIGTRVVGLDLSDGFFSVCNEADNFMGLILRDQNPYDVIRPRAVYPLVDESMR